MSDCRFTLTEADVVAAQRAWWSGVARWQTFLKIAVAGSTLYAGIIIALGYANGRRDPWSLPWSAWGIVMAWPVVVAAIMFSVGYLRMPGMARKNFREQVALRDEIEMSWNEQFLSMRSRRGDVTYSWADFFCWMDGPQTLLIHHSRQLFTCIPKRALASGQLEAIIGRLVEASVPERPRFGYRYRPRAERAAIRHGQEGRV